MGFPVPNRRETDKRYRILETAGRLFAEQGFEATTTVQISREAGVTEPLIYYHFSGKDDLFATILTAVFESLFAKLDAVKGDAAGPLDTIERIIDIHFEIAQEMPHETAVAVRACPVRLKDAAHICFDYVHQWRNRLVSAFERCLKEGMETGQFRRVPVAETVSILIAFINGLIRHEVSKFGRIDGVREAAVSFCRFSLVNP